jgi:arabinose-5-phosphate isomerase
LQTEPTNSSSLSGTGSGRDAALRTLRLEAEAIAGLAERLGEDFDHTVSLVLQHGESGGRLVFTGIGKSADVARKTVATLNSTGTPAAFLHAADALHGDLGMVGQEDVVIAVSKSGATAELVQLLPLLQARQIALVAMVGRTDSPVAKAALHTLDVGVEQEACPHDLAPTTSSAAQLAMGDALAMALMEARGFSSEDFARHHPGGSLGRRLLLRLGDLVDDISRVTIAPDCGLRDVVPAVSSGRVGAVAVLDGAERLLGIVTDGDLRRALERDPAEWASLQAEAVMNRAPHCLDQDTLAADALERIEMERISQIVVTEADGRFLGFVHLHQLMDAGIR